MSPDEASSQLAPAGRKKPRYFYGWNIVGAAFLAHLAYAEHLSSVLGLFFKSLQKEFGWSRTEISAVQSLGRVVEALVAPIVGPFVDRYGARVLMPIGAIILGLAMLATTQVNSLWMFYLLRGGLAAIGFVLVGALVLNVTINNWFVRKRGRALAIAGLGNNLGTLSMVPITVWVIANHGWRAMFIVFGIMTWVLIILPAIVWMRHRPEDMGLRPDGIEPGAAEAEQGKESAASVTEVVATPEPIWSRREVMTTASFWVLSLSFGVDSMAFQGINISLAPYIQDLGYSDTLMAVIVTYRFAVQAVMGLLSGFLAEHAHRAIVRVYPFVLQAAGSILFLFAGQSTTMLWVAVTVYVSGTLGVIQEVLWANYYGRLSLGTVRSWGFLVAFGFGAAGPIVMNAVFDIMGSYRPAFMAVTVLFLICGVLMWIVRPPKPKRFATAAEIAAADKKAPSAHH